MKYSREEVMQYVQEEDVKFIRLAFCDVFGKQKNISILPEELPRAFEYGIAFDASAIAGFGDESKCDLLLHPEPETLMLLPWRPEHGKVVRMFTYITYPDGSLFECDTRSLLKKAIEDAKKPATPFLSVQNRNFICSILMKTENQPNRRMTMPAIWILLLKTAAKISVVKFVLL